MELQSYPEFKKDIKKLDHQERKRLKKTLEKMIINLVSGKPMKYTKHTFSKRISGKRLIYYKKEELIILLCFKHHDKAYKWLKENYEKLFN